MYNSKAVGALDLNTEYSPSKNSKRFSDTTNQDQAVLVEFLKNITEQMLFRVWVNTNSRCFLKNKLGTYEAENRVNLKMKANDKIKETKTAREKYNVRQSVPYRRKSFNVEDGILDNQVVDIYYGDIENGTPIFVYIHGGYWQELDRHTSGSFVEPLVQKGSRVVVVDYNLCPTVTLQQLNEQIKNFYEWLFNYAMETQASKISFSGHSAGAHLLTPLFDNSLLSLPFADRIESFFLLSGVFDLRECWNLSSVNPENILGVNTETHAEALSPICWELDAKFIELAKKRNIRIYVLVAEHDSETFKGQSLAYAKKFKKAGLQVEYEVFQDYDHFSIIENVPVKDSLINKYLLCKL